MSNPQFNFLRIIALCEDPKKLISQLQGWGVLAKEENLRCPEQHCTGILKLNGDNEKNFLWYCPGKIIKSKKKAVPCKKRFSLKRGTFFNNSKLTIKEILLFVYLWTRKFYYLDQIKKELDISAQTATEWQGICYEVVTEYIYMHPKKQIGGPGMIVEIDESKFGKRKYNCGHPVEGQWVLGGICRETGEVFLIPVESRDAKTLLARIKEWVLPGTTIYTDCWRAYSRLISEGYEHSTVNHKLHFKDPDTGVHTNTIEGLWRHVKVTLPQYHRQKECYADYLCKYMFYNLCKQNHLDPFVEFLKMAGEFWNPYDLHKPEVPRDE